MQLRLLAPALLALAGAFVHVAPASACSVAPPCLELYSVHPAPGAENMPLNVQLRVAYTEHADRDRLVLETEAGVVVPVTWDSDLGPSWYVGSPTQPLEPSTTYVLKHRYTRCEERDVTAAANDDRCGWCEADVATEIARFTTGASSDTEAPATPSIGEVEVDEPDGELESAACGPYLMCTYRAELAGEAGTTLRIYRDGLLVGESSDHVILGWMDGPGSNGFSPLESADVQGYGAFEVRLLDHAGNLSEPVAFEVEECQWPEEFFAPDEVIEDNDHVEDDTASEPPATVKGAGDADGTPNAGSGDGEPTSSTRASSGCSVAIASTQANQTALASSLLLGLCALVRARRRASAAARRAR